METPPWFDQRTEKEKVADAEIAQIENIRQADQYKTYSRNFADGEAYNGLGMSAAKDRNEIMAEFQRVVKEQRTVLATTHRKIQIQVSETAPTVLKEPDQFAFETVSAKS